MNRFAAEWIMRFIDPNFEPHFLLGYSDGSRNPAIDFARILFGWHEALRRRVPQEPAPLLSLIAAFKRMTSPRSATPRFWVEKTPRNEVHIEKFEYFSAARFIQLVRDPRTTLASLRELYNSADIARFDPADHARKISRSFRLARENSHKYGNRYLVVRYEDLVDQTAQTISSIGKFLQIDLHETLFVPTVCGHDVRANSSFGKYRIGVIEPSRLSAALPPEQASLVVVYAGKAAQLFGYEVSFPGPISRFIIRLQHGPRHALQVANDYLRAALLKFRRSN